MSKSKKKGAVLDIHIMSRCADLLMQVEPERRLVIVQWLSTSVVHQQKETPPPPSGPEAGDDPFRRSAV